jgi:pimeloyl-ACP methyl ester carboxylesterase
MIWLGIAVGALVGTVGISYLVEAARRRPVTPAQLRWAPDIPVRSLDVNGIRLRYIVAGEGPALVLLHTLRTQLDMFHKVVPALATRFRVHALDYPGHGYSDIPRADYSADFFVDTVAAALERLEVKEAIVVGESIGGSIGLLLAARHNPRVAGVVAVNPYDYAGGRGIRRSSAAANLVFGLNDVPVVGATVQRLRLPPISSAIMAGGVRRKGAISGDLGRELYLVGNRPGHMDAFMSLVRNWASWDAARAEYPNIDRPVLLVYGDHDWSHPDEREADARAIPRAELQTIVNAGHFVSLDAPDELINAIFGFADAREKAPAGR